MTATVLQYLFYLILLTALAIPLGGYIAKIFKGESNLLIRFLSPCEKGIYRLLKIDKGEEMTAGKYTKSVLAFSVFGFIFLFLLQLLQGFLPGNPQGLPGVEPALSFNTTASFVTNTNWQAYSGEATLSYLTQALGLTVQNFLSAATGIAVLFALIRGFIGVQKKGLGSFWVDITRTTVYLLIPINIVLSVALIGGGVVQNFGKAETVPLLEPIATTAQGEIIKDAVIDTENKTAFVNGKEIANAIIITDQFVPMGPGASQIAIKQTGTNGGGFFGVNSAHPFENPNAFTNLLEMLSLLLIPAALCFTFGKCIKNRRQGVAIFLAMFICLAAALTIIAASEQMATPELIQEGAVNISATDQSGGNMEGKESRFGMAESNTWAAFTTAASNGSVNAMHDSLTPMGGMITMLQMQLGEVIFGGVGCGLYGMLAFAILTVFIAGLMVGRTPEFLGKKIEPFEMKWAAVICLATPVLILAGSGIAAAVPQVLQSVQDGGSHGFSELLYAFSSAGGNNGSAFAGFNANTLFLNLLLGIVMLFARFLPIVGVLAIAGSLSQKKKLAVTAGTLSTSNAMFVFLLILVVLLIGALSFFPALALGPIAEQLRNFI